MCIGDRGLHFLQPNPFFVLLVIILLFPLGPIGSLSAMFAQTTNQEVLIPEF